MGAISDPCHLQSYLDALCRDAEHLCGEVDAEGITVGRSNGDWVVEIRSDRVCARDTHPDSLVIAFHEAVNRFLRLQATAPAPTEGSEER